MTHAFYVTSKGLIGAICYFEVSCYVPSGAAYCFEVYLYAFSAFSADNYILISFSMTYSILLFYSIQFIRCSVSTSTTNKSPFIWFPRAPLIGRYIPITI